MPDIGQEHKPVDLVYSNPQPFELNVLLPRIQKNEQERMESTSRSGPQRIGLHREVPYSHTGNLSNKLTWKKDGGGLVAYLRIHSPKASSIRFLGNLRLPADATVTFYWIDPSREIRSIDSFTTTSKGLNEEEYWSPHAIGESIGVEIRLTKPNHKSGVKLELLTVAHRFETAGTVGTNELECTNHEDIQCAIDNEEISEGSTKSVLKLTFESEGFSYSCSGTIINVSDGEGVYIPYIITAAHCISNRAVASTVVAWWNYQAASCEGGSTSSDFRYTYGGADLLATVQSYDQTLIRLRNDPPAGTWFSGWWTADVGVGVNGIGAHHPGGEHKKFFSGNTTGNTTVNVCDEDDNCFLLIDSIVLRMQDGTAEAGSSGSGLRIVYPGDNEYRLVGVLSASDSECYNSDTYIGELRHFYPYISSWLDPPLPSGGDDHGDTTDTATLIKIASTTEGEIEDADDVDYFQVEADRPGTIKVYTTGSLDTVGKLTSESGDLEVTDDDSGQSFNFSLSADIEVGTYYIKVEGYSNLTGDYTLHVEFEESDDHGNDRFNATAISVGARNWELSTIAHLEDNDDKDVFEIIIGSDCTITIYTEGKTDTTGTLTNFVGVDLLENNNTSENNLNFTMTGFLEVGTYFLIIDGSVKEKSEYELFIEVEE